MTQQPTESIWDSNNIALTLGSIMAVTIAAFQGLAVATIAPVVTKDLGGEHIYGWMFNAFLIPQIIGTVLGGREVDRRPPWHVFYPSLVFTGIGLAVCGMADTMSLLLIGRALVGFASGVMFSTVYAIIGASYSDRLRPSILAAISSAWVIPSLIGPVLAGAVADTWHWRWVFYGLIPLLVLIMFLTWKSYFAVRLTQDPEAAKLNRTRLPLAVLLAFGTFLFLAGPDLSALAALVGDTITSVPLVVAIAVTILGLVIIAPTLGKLLPEGTFTLQPMLPAAIALRGLTFGGFAITETYVVYSLKTFGGLSSSQAGIILTIGSLTWTAGSILQARMDRTGGPEGRAGRMIFGSLTMLIASGVIVANVLLAQDIWWPLAAVAWAASGLGIGLCFTTATTVAFAHAPKGQDGVVSSSFLLFDLFTNAIGVGIGGFVLALGLDRLWGEPTSAGLAMALSLVCFGGALLAALRMARHTAGAPLPAGA